MPSGNSLNRFNDASGIFALQYFAANVVTALLEVVAFYGSYGSGFVRSPPPARRWTIFRYRINQSFHVVDLSNPNTRSTARTSTQELTGDWLSYYHRQIRNPSHYANMPLIGSGNLIAPTQQLAQTIFTSTKADGFLTPSAKVPTFANLVLFYNRLPKASIETTGTATVII